MLKRVYKATACNIAIQDGEAAGQSVKHVHAHVIPRVERDMEERGGGDRLYEELEGEEGDVGRWQREQEGRETQREGKERKGKFPKVEDHERKARSMEEMEEEARWLGEEMEREVREGASGSSL
jgi:bis(5'-adenosyl)-triphosphatase